MADKKDPTRTIIDVAHPGNSAPSDTSKPILVSNRPMLKDPMMVGAKKEELVSEDPEIAEKTPQDSERHEAKGIESDSVETQTDTTSKVDTESSSKEADSVVEVNNNSAEDIIDEHADTLKDPDSEISEVDEAKFRDEAIQKLIDSRKYYLPINAVEQKRTRRFVVLGVFLSLLLAVAWLDIALDAGLIQLGDIEAVTNFF